MLPVFSSPSPSYISRRTLLLQSSITNFRRWAPAGRFLRWFSVVWRTPIIVSVLHSTGKKTFDRFVISFYINRSPCRCLHDNQCQQIDCTAVHSTRILLNCRFLFKDRISPHLSLRPPSGGLRILTSQCLVSQQCFYMGHLGYICSRPVSPVDTRFHALWHQQLQVLVLHESFPATLDVCSSTMCLSCLSKK